LANYIGDTIVETNTQEIPKIYLGTIFAINPTMVDPFYTSLLVKGWLVHNCMLDSGASSNVIPIEVVNLLGFKVSRSYGNCYAMDSTEVNVIRVVNGVEVKLVAYLGKCFLMDIIIVDCPTKWGMLLSRKWETSIGGSI